MHVTLTCPHVRYISLEEFISTKNGLLSFDGFPTLTEGQLGGLFGDCDVNGDGMLSLEEFTEVRGRVRGRVGESVKGMRG